MDEAGQIGGRQMLELVRFIHQRHGRLVLSGDTRQHGAVDASDALLAIERHAGVKPIELHKIRRQDPALGRDHKERKRIWLYRKAVEAAAAGKLGDSFERLDKIGAIVACGIGEQAEKLANEYLQITEQNVSAIVVSQTWGEVHRVNSRVRDALKGKGLLGKEDSAIEALEKIDLTKAQKHDERFYPPDAVILFNQKVRNAEPGAKGTLVGVLKSSILVDVEGKFVTVSNRLLDRVTVCQARDLSITNGDRLHLKANRKLASGGRVTNGEFVNVKSVRADGGVELTDGRVLDKSFREFLSGYAVTSYGSQGKTVDLALVIVADPRPQLLLGYVVGPIASAGFKRTGRSAPAIDRRRCAGLRKAALSGAGFAIHDSVGAALRTGAERGRDIAPGCGRREHMIDYPTFDEIRRLRDQEQLSVAQIAAALQLDERTVSKWIDVKKYQPRQTPPRPSILDPFKATIA